MESGQLQLILSGALVFFFCFPCCDCTNHVVQ